MGVEKNVRFGRILQRMGSVGNSAKDAGVAIQVIHKNQQSRRNLLLLAPQNALNKKENTVINVRYLC
jgi:hypothetical protein